MRVKPTVEDGGNPPPTMTGCLRTFIEASATRQTIIAVIIINAVVIGLETSPTAMAAAGEILLAIDTIALAIFVAEIGIKLFVYRAAFFGDPWNLFDFAIVAVSLAPAGAGEGVSVLRALRILRALRLISLVPRMRIVIQALLQAIPGMGSVLALLSLVFYVAAVMATKLFGPEFDAWFGTVGRSAFSLFQIMTLESWSIGIVRPVMEVHPYAWAFFVPFILIATFAVLNLFIAIMVNSMHDAAATDAEQQAKAHDSALRSLVEEIGQLRHEIAMLSTAQDAGSPKPAIERSTRQDTALLDHRFRPHQDEQTG